MTRTTPRSKRTDPRVPFTTLFRTKGIVDRRQGPRARPHPRERRILKEFGDRPVRRRPRLEPPRIGAPPQFGRWPGAADRRRWRRGCQLDLRRPDHRRATRSGEHTSELQTLMPTSYAVLCLKKITTIP